MRRHYVRNSAQEAERIGLVDFVSAEGGLDDTVSELAKSVLANSWFANAAHKRIMQETVNLPIDAALARGREIWPGHAPDSLERIASFTKK